MTRKTASAAFQPAAPIIPQPSVGANEEHSFGHALSSTRHTVIRPFAYDRHGANCLSVLGTAPSKTDTEATAAHKLARTLFAVLRDAKPYHDPDTDHEALLVKRNASRWIRMLQHYDVLQTLPDGKMRVRFA